MTYKINSHEAEIADWALMLYIDTSEDGRSYLYVFEEKPDLGFLCYILMSLGFPDSIDIAKLLLDMEHAYTIYGKISWRWGHLSKGAADTIIKGFYPDYNAAVNVVSNIKKHVNKQVLGDTGSDNGTQDN